MNRLGQNNSNRPDTYNDVWTPYPNASMQEQITTNRPLQIVMWKMAHTLGYKSLNISSLPNKYAKKIGVSSLNTLILIISRYGLNTVVMTLR